MFICREDFWPIPKGNLGDPIVAEYLAAVKRYLERVREEVYKSSRVGGSEGRASGGPTGGSFSSNKQEP